MKKCVFCLVIKKNQPHHEIIWRDKNHIAFLDAYPFKDGHTLVIPKKHTDYLFAMQSKEYGALLEAARMVAVKLKRSSGCKRVVLAVEGFSVSHVHIHLLPLNKELSLVDLDDKHKAKATPKHLALVAQKIRKQF